MLWEKLPTVIFSNGIPMSHRRFTRFKGMELEIYLDHILYKASHLIPHCLYFIKDCRGKVNTLLTLY